jgi:hypothetical protein
MYILAFGAKIRIFFEGGISFWPSQKNFKKNQKINFAPDPQFLFNLQELEELRCLQKTSAQKNEN